ncbi:MAG: carbamoyl transferase, partial [Candidatus Methylomirabilis sp.]|nr:carbamoyl transferase [Deltaproteobacteria bacterium]
GGLALGAALALTGERRPLGHVFLGPSYPESEVEEALRAGGFRMERPSEPHENVASALASGEVAAVFSGQLELGPRALGGRSLLAPADRPEVLRRLGEALDRPLFMPFAPAILAEDLTRYLKMPPAAAPSAAFMTLAVPATDVLRRELPAAVHEDGTVRPQIVRENDASGLHPILAAYKRRTGHGAAINTSFNGHGEPIVASPADALATARRCGIRKLAMGPFWVEL